MRALRLLVTGVLVALTLLAGFVLAFFAAVLALAIQLVARLTQKPSRPSSTARDPTPAPAPTSPSGPSPHRVTRADRADAIEVTATEIPPPPPPR